ncbi:MAG TPA: hypothetical protein VMR51_02015 [Patescibacteria group bacterium]|jgi:hypothetical protein|nr:hypothetical protein [Patescibacteria group bacterium]
MRNIYLILGVAVFVILLIFIIFGLNRPVTTTNNSKPVIMSDFADTNADVIYTTEGIINGDELHRIIKITVDKNSRMVEVISGYQGTIIKSESFTNNSSAFKAFLASLQAEGFIAKRSKPGSTNSLGQCPLGTKYYFDSTGITGAPGDLWITSCSAKIGTFAGSLNSVQQLFQLQIPDYNNIVSGVNLK